MARDFSGTAQYLQAASLYNFTSEAFSFSGWWYFDALTSSPVLFFKGQFEINGYYCQVSTAGKIEFYTNQAAAQQVSSTADSAVTTGAWTHIGVTRNGATVKIYVNGSNVTNTSGSHTNPLTSSDDFVIGAYDDFNPGFTPVALLDGKMAEFGVWSGAALDDAEMVSLGKAVAPRCVRPSSLADHFSMFGRTTDEIGAKGTVLTNTSTTYADHPRVFYSYPRLTFPSATKVFQATIRATNASGTDDAVVDFTVGPSVAVDYTVTPTQQYAWLNGFGLAYDGWTQDAAANTLLDADRLGACIAGYADSGLPSGILARDSDLPLLAYDNVGNTYLSNYTEQLKYADDNTLDREAFFYHAGTAIVGTEHAGSTRPVTWFWAAVQNEATDRYAVAHTTGFVVGGTIGNTLDLGMPEKFDRVEVNLSAASSGGWVGTWQYWNGSAWAALTVTSDGTSGMTVDGTVVFTVPADWAPKYLTGDPSVYWVYPVRLRTTTGGTGPTLVTITGEDYCGAGIPDSGTWTIPVFDYASDVGSKGYLTPAEYAGRAAGKDARFEHQTRVFTTYGQHRYQTRFGASETIAWAVDHVEALLAALPTYSAIFMDNGGATFPCDVGDVTETITLAGHEEDYAGLLEACRNAIWPKWIISNVSGARANLAGATPQVNAAIPWFYEFNPKPISYNYHAFLDFTSRVLDWRTSYPNVLGVLDADIGIGGYDDRTKMAALACYHMVSHPSKTMLSFFGGNAPTSSWTDHWIDAANYNIGSPTGAYTDWATGADPDDGTLTYHVYRRVFTGGTVNNVVVLYKPRSATSNGSSSGSTSGTATSHALGANYKAVQADGTLGTTVSSVDLRNGEGVILVPQ